jgi:hypothetical protein
MNPALKQRCEQFIEGSRFHPERIRVLSQGDSWLSLPGGLWSGRNVPQNLNSKTWAQQSGRPVMNVLNVANPGKILDKMISDPDLKSVLTYLQLRSEQDDRHYGFDAVVITGGGNDILDNPRALIGPGTGQGELRTEAVRAAMERIAFAWQPIISLFKPWGVPILAHGYGPIIPTRRSGSIIIPFKTVGPWVGPYLLDELHLKPARAKALVSSVIDELNTTLQSIPGLTYFDVRAIVASIPATGWHDEIHFLQEGWGALAEAWHDAISSAVQATSRRAKASANPPPLIAKSSLLTAFVSPLIAPAAADGGRNNTGTKQRARKKAVARVKRKKIVR